MPATYYPQNQLLENNQGLHYSHFSPIRCTTEFANQIVTNASDAKNPEKESESAKSG